MSRPQIQKIDELIALQLRDPLGPSFHDSYKDSCYISVGGLDIRMTEGDVITVFSQWGEIVDINLIRDRDTGEPKGFGFLAYEDQRSTVLAVDNGNGMRLLNRTLKVDHVKNYAMFLKREEGPEKGNLVHDERKEPSRRQPDVKDEEVKDEVKHEVGRDLYIQAHNQQGRSEEYRPRGRDGWDGHHHSRHGRGYRRNQQRGRGSDQDERIWRNSPPTLPQGSVARRARRP